MSLRKGLKKPAGGLVATSDGKHSWPLYTGVEGSHKMNSIFPLLNAGYRNKVHLFPQWPEPTERLINWYKLKQQRIQRDSQEYAVSSAKSRAVFGCHMSAGNLLK